MGNQGWGGESPVRWAGIRIMWGKAGGYKFVGKRVWEGQLVGKVIFEVVHKLEKMLGKCLGNLKESDHRQIGINVHNIEISNHTKIKTTILFAFTDFTTIGIHWFYCYDFTDLLLLAFTDFTTIGIHWFYYFGTVLYCCYGKRGALAKFSAAPGKNFARFFAWKKFAKISSIRMHA
jgi:hypothetical protein